jgi:hypothetical protein
MRRSPIKSPGGVEIRGSYVIVAIVLIAVVAAAAPLAYRYFRSRDVLALWGPEAALLIHDEADEIWLDVVETAGTPGPEPSFDIQGRSYAVARRKNISQARGLLNARQALVENKSFLWGQARGDCQPRWEYALVFVAGETGRKATIAVDTQCNRALLLETGAEIALQPRIAQALHDFVREQLLPPKPSTPTPEP